MAKRKKEKIKLPYAAAGLLRYDEEIGKGLAIKPEYVVIASLGIIALRIIAPYLIG